MEQRYFNVRQASEYLGVSEAFLNLARHKGTGPPYVRPANVRRVFYDKAALDEWMSAAVHNGTSEYHTSESYRAKQSPGRPRNAASGMPRINKRPGKLAPLEETK